MNTSKISYHSLKTTEPRDSCSSRSLDQESDLEDGTTLNPKAYSSRILSLLPRLVVILFAIWGFLSLLATLTQHTKPTALDIYRPNTLPQHYSRCDCGNTLDEARSKRCTYDSMGAAWLPDYCRDDDLTATFARSGTEPDGSWPYYADKNGTQRVSVEEIAAMGKGSFYATRYWHVAHCLFYWEK